VVLTCVLAAVGLSIIWLLWTDEGKSGHDEPPEEDK